MAGFRRIRGAVRSRLTTCQELPDKSTMLDIVADHSRENNVEQEPPLAGPLLCSFCARSASTSGRLVAGPGVAICQDCAEASMKLLAERMPPGGGSLGEDD